MNNNRWIYWAVLVALYGLNSCSNPDNGNSKLEQIGSDSPSYSPGGFDLEDLLFTPGNIVDLPVKGGIPLSGLTVDMNQDGVADGILINGDQQPDLIYSNRLDFPGCNGGPRVSFDAPMKTGMNSFVTDGQQLLISTSPDYVPGGCTDRIQKLKIEDDYITAIGHQGLLEASIYVGEGLVPRPEVVLMMNGEQVPYGAWFHFEDEGSNAMTLSIKNNGTAPFKINATGGHGPATQFYLFAEESALGFVGPGESKDYAVEFNQPDYEPRKYAAAFYFLINAHPETLGEAQPYVVQFSGCDATGCEK